MGKDGKINDLPWFLLYSLSLLTAGVWIVLSLVLAVVSLRFVMRATGEHLVAAGVLVWIVVLSRVGLGWISFTWDKILYERDR